MGAKTSLAVLLLVSVCLVGYTSAWGFSRRNSSSNRYASNSISNGPIYNYTVIAVRRVDEEHPYFRTYKFSRNATLSDLKFGLKTFLNQADNVTMIVKNDRLLLTRDVDVLLLSYKDSVEVWFTNSDAPTRSRTYYTYSKAARKPSWSSKDKGKSEKDKGKKDKSKRDRRVRGRSNEEDSMFDEFDSF